MFSANYAPDSDRQELEKAFRLAVQTVHQHVADDLPAQAILYLLVRAVNTWRSIYALWNNCPGTFAVDAGTLLRAMFDAFLQAAFITQDPGKCDERAKLYLEFEDIERWKMIERIFRHDTFLSRHLKASPKRSKAQPRVKARYAQLKKRYLRRNGRVRNSWYAGNLRSMAEKVGKSAEYDQLLALFHGCVHSSPFALRYGPMVAPEHVSTLAAVMAAGVARIALHQVDARLDSPSQELIDELSADFLKKL